MSAAEWGEAHRREALRRTYEIAAELVGDPSAWIERRPGHGIALGACAHGNEHSEKAFRQTLSIAGLDPARIDREVRRVRALAEGRLVRENGWRGTAPDGSVRAWTDVEATAHRWRETGSKVVRVTRIRRRS